MDISTQISELKKKLSEEIKKEISNDSVIAELNSEIENWNKPKSLLPYLLEQQG
ncbi:MAG: hypothetical protein HC831_14265 [Chloroflexia bacterium]|nr:hypothetical protein [Chloroflexia bacterium]